MPAPDRDAGPKTEEMPCGDEGRSNGAVGVLKRKDQRRRRTGLEQAWGPNPRRQLGHLEGAQRGVFFFFFFFWNSIYFTSHRS